MPSSASRNWRLVPKRPSRRCGAEAKYRRSPCAAYCVTDLDRCAAHGEEAMRRLGYREAALVRPDQLMSWPASDPHGAGAVHVVVPHRRSPGCRSNKPPRPYWCAEVDCSPEWLAEYQNRCGFGYMFEVEGITTDSEDEPALHAYDVTGTGPVSVRFNIDPLPEWVGRTLACSIGGGYTTDDEGFDVPVETYAKVGTITGLTRHMLPSRDKGQPWATVFELGIDEALVFGDELQAMGRSMDGLVLVHAATGEPLTKAIAVALGLRSLGGLLSEG